MYTLYIYKYSDDTLLTSFSGESNAECEEKAFVYLGDDYYATYTEQ